MDNNWLQKAFWFVIRYGYDTPGEDQTIYAIYNRDRNLIKSTLAAAIKTQAG